VTVLDVRPEDEFQHGHVPGAVNVPLSQVDTWLRRRDKKTEIIAYCRGPYCVRSF
jgi:ArsR family transcriptional regulator